MSVVTDSTKLRRKMPLLDLFIVVMANYVGGQCEPEIMGTNKMNTLVRDESPTFSQATSENFTTTETPFSGKEAMLAFSLALRGLVFCTTGCKADLLKLEERVYRAWWGKYAIGEQGKHRRDIIFWMRIKN